VSDDEDDEETLSNPATGSQSDKLNPNSSTLTKSLKNGKYILNKELKFKLCLLMSENALLYILIL